MHTPHTHAHARACTHARMCVHTHTHTHTHTVSQGNGSEENVFEKRKGFKGRFEKLTGGRMMNRIIGCCDRYSGHRVWWGGPVRKTPHPPLPDAASLLYRLSVSSPVHWRFCCPALLWEWAGPGRLQDGSAQFLWLSCNLFNYLQHLFVDVVVKTILVARCSSYIEWIYCLKKKKNVQGGVGVDRIIFSPLWIILKSLCYQCSIGSRFWSLEKLVRLVVYPAELDGHSRKKINRLQLRRLNHFLKRCV